jgi:hypothetical protein
MNEFVKKNSFLSVLLTLFCAAALFNDGANLTDLYTSITTVHFDEVDGTTAAQAGVSTVNGVPSFSSYCHLNRPGSISGGKTVSPTRLILDQDSPSLTPILIAASPKSGLGVEEATVVHKPARIAASLYLQNCSLLL